MNDFLFSRYFEMSEKEEIFKNARILQIEENMESN